VYRVTIRRREANGRVHDFTVRAESPRELRGQLRSLLQTSQSERGTGLWSRENPEVWIGDAFLGASHPDGDVGRLADAAAEKLGATVPSQSPGLPKRKGSSP
jgi:hypothetical protein